MKGIRARTILVILITVSTIALEFPPVTIPTIKAQSQLHATITTNPHTSFVINGENINFTVSTTGGSRPYTYQWDFDDGTTTSTLDNQIFHKYTPSNPSIINTGPSR